MVVLAGEEGEEALGGRVPRLALLRAAELRAEGVRVLVVEEGDDVRRDFRMVGRYGLLTYLEDHFQAPFGYVRASEEGGRRMFEASLLPSGRFLLVAPDEDWLDDRLRVTLDVESEGWTDGGPFCPADGWPFSHPVPDGDRSPAATSNKPLSVDGSAE
ncbi:hypothetical protein GMSM_42660 [Geomonas sp. Red276]